MQPSFRAAGQTHGGSGRHLKNLKIRDKCLVVSLPILIPIEGRWQLNAQIRMMTHRLQGRSPDSVMINRRGLGTMNSQRAALIDV